ncbi:Merozoite surface protein 7 [Plasmodium coatneyi]|uniref:Merozoite surface protein 7 n=1 Tax=Plasmodium coatneyi TaxID=208452 RepID=A0A1B1E4Z6_9APIC|nr:Merozoite surface protein 7 [Plasmodium coatneyi]ANQ10102.1 Merozoite surface protein 7 [Plasmodium coatneyi]
MNGKIFLLAIFFLTLHVVASYDGTDTTGTNYKPKNEKSKKTGKNNKTDSEELFTGQNIIQYFKNILNDVNNDSTEDSNVSENGKLTGQLSEEDPTTNGGTNEEDGDDEENAPEEDATQSGEQSGAPQGGQNEGEVQSPPPAQREKFSGSSLDYADELYEEILSSLSKKDGEEGTNYDDKYNDFKKEYDMFISLSKDEYEIIGKLIDAFSMYNDGINEDADSVYEAIKKSFTDPKFKQEFKDFMNGIYSYAERKHHIRGAQTEQAKTYLMLFQNVYNQKKKNNLEQDAIHILMKKLESLYKLSATNNSEVFTKEIETLKKQIDQLQQQGGVIEGESLGHLLENEAANESNTTIFGVDEDDLDNYDVDFTGQSKGKIKGQSSKYQKKVTGNDETSEGAPGVGGAAAAADNGPVGASTANSVSQGAESSGNPSGVAGAPSGSGTPETLSEPSEITSTGGSQQSDAVEPSTGDNVAANANAAHPPPQVPSPSASAPAGQAAQGLVPEVKYLDKLYDEVLNTENANNGIHVHPYHSKYNDFRKNYEFTMNEQEYQIMKKLFDVFFKKEEGSNSVCPIAFFKKVLDDLSLQKQFDNFQKGLYGFTKRHNYLRGEKTTNGQLYDELIKNIINLLNTIEMNLFLLAQHPTWGADAPDGVTNIFNADHNLLNSLKEKLHNLNEIMQDGVSGYSHEVDEPEKQEEENVEVEEHQHGNTLEDPTEENEGNENDLQESIHLNEDADFIGQWINFVAEDEDDPDDHDDDMDSEEDTEGEQDADAPSSSDIEQNGAPVFPAEQSTPLSNPSDSSVQIGQQHVQASEDNPSGQENQETREQQVAEPEEGSLEGGPGTSPGTESESQADSLPPNVERSDAQLPEQEAQSGEALNEQQSDAPADAAAGPTEEPSTAIAVQTTTEGEGTAESNDVNITFLDKLYDDIINTSDSKNEIHNTPYHTKYNAIRNKYELSMNPVEYQIVKNLFEVGFNKEGESSADTSFIDIFKKVLDDEKFQDEFDNFVQGLYGFAKRHNYLEATNIIYQNDDCAHKIRFDSLGEYKQLNMQNEEEYLPAGFHFDLIAADQGNLINSKTEFFGQGKIKLKGNVDGEEAPRNIKSGQAVGKMISKASKYNAMRKKYKFSIMSVEYRIVKNLFHVCFEKEGEQSSASCLDIPQMGPFRYAPKLFGGRSTPLLDGQQISTHFNDTCAIQRGYEYKEALMDYSVASFFSSFPRRLSLHRYYLTTMKSGFVLVSCLLLLCTGPILGEENKKEKKSTHKEDADNSMNDELKALKGKLENLKEQIHDEKLPKKITEDQILMLKKKLEEFKNLKSAQDAKMAARWGQTSQEDKDELDLSDKEFAWQSVNANEDPVMVPRSGVSVEGTTEGDDGEGEAESSDSVDAAPNVSQEVSPQPSSPGAPGPSSEPAPEAPVGSDNPAQPTNPAGSVGSAGLAESAGSVGSAAPNQKVNSPAKLHHLDLLYDELLAGDNQKNMMDEGQYHSKYNNFRKKYDQLILNQTEYDVSLKLLDKMLSSGKVGEEKINALIETFKKAMDDEEYGEKFKNLISGVYGFAKRNNFLDGSKMNDENYNKLFDYIGSLMNTLLL